MNIASAVLQVGAVAFVIIATICFQKAEAKATTRKPVALDLSDVPPFLPPPEEDETENETL